MMTPRENIIGMLKRKSFDYYPGEFWLCPSLAETFQENTQSSESFSDYFNFGWRGAGLVDYPEQNTIDWAKFYDFELAEGVTFDKFGVAHEPGSEAAQHMTRMRHPMATFDSLEQFETFPYPDPAKASTAHLKKNADYHHDNGNAAMGFIGATAWEVPWYLRSMEELMMDMMEGDEKAVYHFNRCVELSCFAAEEFAKAGCDIMHIGDDIGMQHSIMLSEDMYREWIKPSYKKIVAAAKKINPDVIFSYHSCGYVIPFIQDFIDVGIDVLNPIQPECMDFSEIHFEYGDRLSFWGTVGTQTTMPFGTPEDVREVVLKNLEIAGEKGGLLCAPTHLIEPEVPWDNIMAYVNALAEFNKVNFNYEHKTK